MTAGNGTLKMSGLGSNTAAKEAIKVGFDYFKANAHRVSASIKTGDHDYHLHVVELHNTGPTTAMTLATFVALCSGGLGQADPAADGRPGQHEPGREHHSGREPGRVAPGGLRRRGQALLLPMASVKDIPTIPGELFAKFQTGFYADPVDAVFKALGVG